jgi:hypothetical protein
MSITHELHCQMKHDCPTPVSYIDEKGFVYCEKHGLERRNPIYCRKLRPHELRKLQRGEPIHY